MTSHERQSVANHQQICSLFKFVEANTTSIKENIKTPHYWPFVCQAVTDGFPSTRDINGETAFMTWRHHSICIWCCTLKHHTDVSAISYVFLFHGDFLFTYTRKKILSQIPVATSDYRIYIWYFLDVCRILKYRTHTRHCCDVIMSAMVSNHRCLVCLHNCLFRRRSKKTS